MKTFVYTLCILLLPTQVLWGQQAYTLAQCKQLARENNVALHAARNRITAAEEQQKEVFTTYFPQVSLSGFAFNANKDMAKMEARTADLLPSSLATSVPAEVLTALPESFSMGFLKNGVVGSVAAVQPLYAGGQIANGNRLARIGVEVGRLQQRLSEDEVERTVEQYFWQLVSLQEKQRTLQSVHAMLDELEKNVGVAVEAGVALPNDLLSVQLKTSEVESQQLAIENAADVSSQLLAQYVGRAGEPFTVDFRLDSVPAFPLALKHDHQEALRKTSTYQLLEKNVDASVLQRRLSVGKQLPTVVVGAAYAYNNLMDRDRSFGVVFASVSVPISGWWGGTHAVRRADVTVRDAQEQQQDKGELLVIGMNNAWAGVETSYKQLQLAQKNIRQSEENLRLNRNYYRAGTVALSDLLDAQQQYQQTHDRYTDAYIAYQTALLTYRQAVGED